MKRLIAVVLCAVIFLPLTGSIHNNTIHYRADWSATDESGLVWLDADYTMNIPHQTAPEWLDQQQP